MNTFDEGKLVLVNKEKFKIWKSTLKSGKVESTWNYQFRMKHPIANFYTKTPITNFTIVVGGAKFGTNYGNCIPVKNNWFKLQFFLNDPVIPFNALLNHDFSFIKKLDENETDFEWPDIYYIPVMEVEGDTVISTSTEDECRNINTELIVQSTGGLYNCLKFQNGLAGEIYCTEDSFFRILPYDRIVKYLKNEIKLYKSAANNDKADSMNIAKEMFRDYKEFLKDELELSKETNLQNL